MDTSALKKFAPEARRKLIKLVTSRMNQVLSMDSAEIREKGEAVNKLSELIQSTSKEAVIDRVAYIWFNRFCALRFMDVNRYTNIGTVSPVEGYSQPEILQEAKQGHIDEDLDRFIDKQKVYDLLSGKIPSSDPQQEAYRLLLVGICNNYHTLMPFMFQHIEDYTELLMPEDLLSQNSILQSVRDALTEDDCENVEIIGWLYQFYVSEKKDEVFDALKRNIKITPENIPAATQLFTPHWIVKYLVENSLGRLWMLNRPNSRLIDQMDYYIKPEQEERDYLRINSPEEIKFCDIACGSGHMLIYGFDILYFIYEEEGYDASEIPRLILENNLYGIEIDERAGELAAFCLFMKAREKYKGFFRKPVQPNICVLENIEFTDDELEQYMDKIGRDLFTASLLNTLNQFNEADNFGSLIRPELTDVENILKNLESKDLSGQLFLSHTHQKVLKVLQQANYLSPKYHVVITNPPYMGNRNMNRRLQVFAKNNYPDSKSDLFAMFIESSLDLAQSQGFIAMITMQSWMFLGSYGTLRERLLEEHKLIQMFHTGPGIFFDLGAFNVLTTNFIISKSCKRINDATCFIKANDTPNYQDKIAALHSHGSRISIPVANLKNVPNLPLVYWLSISALANFERLTLLNDVCQPRVGLQTGDNVRFVRFWHEVNWGTIGINCHNSIQAKSSGKRWFPYNKGGNYRKWYGNNESVVNWENDGQQVKGFSGSVIRNPDFYFREGIVYSLFGFENFGVRYKLPGFIFDVSGSSIFPEQDLEIVLAFLCSNVAFYYLQALAPTVNFQVGDLARLPLPNLTNGDKVNVSKLSKMNIELCKSDWDSVETSWDFETNPLIRRSDFSFKDACDATSQHFDTQRNALRENEQAINRIMIVSYHLENEVKATVNNRDLSIKVKKRMELIEEFISYAIGCMFGRYSLDKPGLILANQRETIDDYVKQVPTPTFMPDEDNVIPILDSDWFIDGITDRFRIFLRVTFGEEHYEENLKFLEQAIGKDIRKYFLKDFYNHHIKMYKKRPIYWMFSSSKGSFNALIYMHRYKPDTVSIVLNNYLREFRTKISAKKDNLEDISSSPSSSQKDKTKAIKEIEKLKKVISELEDYERDILYPLATQQIEIDLDDGVKVNYNKFGKALKKIPGLTGK
jgi:type II restriction/modification system DNA methylase subunit YeeA